MFESNFEEAKSHIVDLPDEPPHVVYSMLKYMYGGPIKDPRAEPTLKETLVFFLDLYTIAHRLMIEELTRDAAAQLTAIPALEDPAFLDICGEVFSRLPEFTAGLRKVLTELVSQNLTILVRNDGFQRLLEDHPALAAGVLMSVGWTTITSRCQGETCKGRGRAWSAIDFEKPIENEKDKRCIYCGYSGYLKPVHGSQTK